MSTLLYELEPSVAFPLPQDNNDLNNIINEVFAYKDDIWDISPFLKNPKNYPHSNKVMRFDDIPLRIRALIKQHCYYELGRIKPQSVAGKLSDGKAKLLMFMSEFKLHSLESFDTERFLQYVAWLRDTCLTQPKLKRDTLLKQDKEEEAKKYEPLSDSFLYQTSLWLRQLLDDATGFQWEGSPKESIRLEPSLSFMWGVNGSQVGKKKKEKAEDRVIPNNIWEKIINSAREESEYAFSRSFRNDYQVIYKTGQAKGIKAINFAKYIILIQTFTGLRISEVTSLESDCVFKDKKERKWLRRETSKTALEPQEGDIRIPTEVFEAIKEVDALSKDYREISGLNNLFFAVSSKQNNTISVISSEKWNNKYLLPFMERNNICDENGEIYKVSSHDFRHTFASKLVNEWNVSLTVLTRHYAHLSMEMTMHYVHLSKEKLHKKAIEGFTQASKIIANGEVGENFMKVISEANVEDNFDDLVDKLTRSFGVTSLPFGMCLYDYRRGHCPNIGVQSCWEIGCSSFTTSDKFLPNFEHESDILESQIARDNSLGKVVEAKKKKAKFGKIVKIIQDLSA